VLSSSIGSLGNGAWTHVPGTTDEIFFLSKNGVFRMQTESLRRDLVATPVSKDALPDELIGLAFEYLNPTACLRYDSRWGGVVITDRTAEIAFWYDVKLGGFYRMTFSAYPTVLFHFDDLLTSDASGLLFGGSGYGGLSRFNRTGSEAFVSEQLIGPVKISQSPLYQSVMQIISVMLGGGSSDLEGTLALYTANTAQSSLLRARADDPSYKWETTIGDLVSNGKTAFPRLGGHAVTLKLQGSGTAGKRMVYEGADIEWKDAGRNKDLGLIAPLVTPPSGNLTMSTD
jgi:hypothetical protein